MSDKAVMRREAGHGWIRASLVSVACLLRGLPLFFRAAPHTPLRVLCIIALDTLHVLRHARPLPRERVGELATLLDFQACTNAAWDEKDLCRVEYQVLRRRLEDAGLASCINQYLNRLRDLETQRPAISGDQRRFDDVRSYREAVARLSLATLTTIALDDKCFDDDLFRIAMQCQVIDDVMDYQEDLSAGLPSFLTACTSLPLSLALTARASRSYGASHDGSSGRVFPLRMALRILSALTRLAVRVACQLHSATGQPVPIGLRTGENMSAVRSKR